MEEENVRPGSQMGQPSWQFLTGDGSPPGAGGRGVKVPWVTCCLGKEEGLKAWLCTSPWAGPGHHTHNSLSYVDAQQRSSTHGRLQPGVDGLPFPVGVSQLRSLGLSAAGGRNGGCPRDGPF